ncbi:HlyU family transcriptional regulator [Antarctobacter sp.]|uniref:HlyU family transcriptional regulator n=1 Tax=Antarctobacter sp. TaxID=1872577 RepID=UPI002B26544E|nr:HlyU family transcriptional regulator [Antarctobacter sp.]
MSLLKRLFGGGGADKAPAASAATIDYEGFRITPQPSQEGGQYRIGALIEGEVNGETKSHHLIRADVIRDAHEAADASIRKAKQMIDQMGARLFN